MKKLLCILLALALLAGLLMIDNNRIEKTAYTVTSPDLPEAFQGLRIVEIADLHGKSFGTEHARLLRAVQESSPDLIAIDGDLFDDTTDVRTLDPLLKGLCRIAPTYYVTGNHEWATEHLRDTLAHIEALGVTVLQNEYVVWERDGEAIAVAGVHDPNGPYDMKTKAELVGEIRADLGENAYILMLAHRNGQLDEWADLGVQTVLTGHAHGGIVRIPFVGGLIGVDMELFPTYTEGVFHEGATSMVVSRGLGNSSGLFRVLNAPEMPVITLERESA
ncbi:MAG: metallophosphoesterase [Oscillospiraceae bacterium]|nr:metallophosphoesterase [Oscillospiraceae bacterium]